MTFDDLMKTTCRADVMTQDTNCSNHKAWGVWCGSPCGRPGKLRCLLTCPKSVVDLGRQAWWSLQSALFVPGGAQGVRYDPC